MEQGLILEYITNQECLLKTLTFAFLLYKLLKTCFIDSPNLELNYTKLISNHQIGSKGFLVE